MTMAPIVTPVSSLEDTDTENNVWMTRLTSGSELSQADWELLEQEKGQYPLIDHSKDLKSSSRVVRVRGMVQDMFDTEFFVKAGHETTGQTLMAAPHALAERTPLLITPVPFATNWFRDCLKEGLDDEEHRDKRLRPNEETHAEQEHHSSKQWWNTDLLKTDPRESPILAKFYYEQYVNCSKLRLNDIVELVGVMEEDVAVDDAAESPTARTVGEMSSWEELDDAVVPSGFPRFHVLWYRALDLDQFVPVRETPQGEPPQHVLAKTLGIPQRASHALWLTLNSMAEREASEEEKTTWTAVQTPQGTMLGSASLNLILPDKASCTRLTEQLSAVIGQLVPIVNTVQVSQATLSKLSIPSKERGRLAPTQLQLPKGAVLILNTADLEAGRLSPEATENLKALQQLVTCHRIPYRFDRWATMPFEADIRVIVLSTKARRKILPCTWQVECDSPVVRETVGPASIPTLSRVRDQLVLNRRSSGSHPHNNITLSSELLDHAQHDFVQRRTKAREEKKELPNEQDFHKWLTVTRLHARSRRATTAKIEDWEQSLALTTTGMGNSN